MTSSINFLLYLFLGNAVQMKLIIFEIFSNLKILFQNFFYIGEKII